MKKGIREDKPRYCVIVPTYNNRKTLSRTLSGVLRRSRHVIVVNDGSTDGTAAVLRRFGTRIQTVSFTRNRGKGAALRAGFKKAGELGYEFAVTVDSDGQHRPADIPKLLRAVRPGQKVLVIGNRDMTGAHVPGSSVFGRKFSNFWVWLETGLKVRDAQSGFRLYTVPEINRFLFFTRRFDFEIESLVRWAWKGYPVKVVPVGVYYPPARERVTHFHKFWDNLRISLLNTALVTVLIVWILPGRLLRKLTATR